MELSYCVVLCCVVLCCVVLCCVVLCCGVLCCVVLCSDLIEEEESAIFNNDNSNNNNNEINNDSIKTEKRNENSKMSFSFEDFIDTDSVLKEGEYHDDLEEATDIEMKAKKSSGKFRCVVFRCVVLCCVVLCCIVLCCVVLCCVVLCCVVLCCIVLCCVVLCCAMLCSAIISPPLSPFLFVSPSYSNNQTSFSLSLSFPPQMVQQNYIDSAKSGIFKM